MIICVMFDIIIIIIIVMRHEEHELAEERGEDLNDRRTPVRVPYSTTRRHYQVLYNKSSIVQSIVQSSQAKSSITIDYSKV